MYLLGRTIKERRRALGLTQQQLAAKLSIPTSRLQRIEQGQAKTISPSTLRNISSELLIDGNILLNLPPAADTLEGRLQALPPSTKSQLLKIIEELSAFLSKK
jgi:transcriptional regulator with XRE-family HTH domain